MRGQLGRVLFSGDDVEKQVGLLSGGEAARLDLRAASSVEKPNVLVLDEPTNHLDLEAIHALVEALKAYTGTVLFVSHDRWFVSELATRIVEVTPDGPARLPRHLRRVPGQRCGDDHLDADAVVLKAKRARAETAPRRRRRRAAPRASAESWEEQKRRRNRARAAAQAARQGDGRDRGRRGAQAGDPRRYADPAFYAQTSHDEIDALGEELAALGPKIDALMAEWEAIEREIAEAEAKSDSP